MIVFQSAFPWLKPLKLCSVHSICGKIREINSFRPHIIRKVPIFSVKLTSFCQFWSIFCFVNKHFLRKSNTSNSLQACCSNKNWSLFSKFQFYEAICRTKSHIWCLRAKLWERVLVKNLIFWKFEPFWQLQWAVTQLSIGLNIQKLLFWVGQSVY